MSHPSSRSVHLGCLSSCHLARYCLKLNESIHGAIHIDISPQKMKDHLCHQLEPL
jgi:hypothetical protein